MKNIHVIATNKPSRLVFNGTTYVVTIQTLPLDKQINCYPQQIYITSDEEIKNVDWCFHPLLRGGCIIQSKFDNPNSTMKKIILTTDPDLIKDGVQAIPDEFLEWFVKNTSCEFVHIKKMLQCKWGIDWHDLPNQESGRERDGIYRHIWKILYSAEDAEAFSDTIQNTTTKTNDKLIITQQTLEEANWKIIGTADDTFYNGAKWQSNSTYSKETVDKLLDKLLENNMCSHSGDKLIREFKEAHAH